MHLNENESLRFYHIWKGILEYTNQKHNIDPRMENIRTAKSISLQDIVPIREILWDHTEIIDQFVKENPYSFEQQDLDILSSWKRRIPGKFVMLKHLKNHTIFLYPDANLLYAVTGIVDSIGDMFHPSHLPLMLDAVLVPFEDKIIYDSLLMPYSVHIGSNMKKNLNDEYRNIKLKHGIITTI